MLKHIYEMMTDAEHKAYFNERADLRDTFDPILGFGIDWLDHTNPIESMRTALILCIIQNLVFEAGSILPIASTQTSRELLSCVLARKPWTQYHTSIDGVMAKAAQTIERDPDKRQQLINIYYQPGR